MLIQLAVWCRLHCVLLNGTACCRWLRLWLWPVLLHKGGPCSGRLSHVHLASPWPLLVLLVLLLPWLWGQCGCSLKVKQRVVGRSYWRWLMCSRLHIVAAWHGMLLLLQRLLWRLQRGLQGWLRVWVDLRRCVAACCQLRGCSSSRRCMLRDTWQGQRQLKQGVVGRTAVCCVRQRSHLLLLALMQSCEGYALLCCAGQLHVIAQAHHGAQDLQGSRPASVDAELGASWVTWW